MNFLPTYVANSSSQPSIKDSSKPQLVYFVQHQEVCASQLSSFYLFHSLLLFVAFYSLRWIPEIWISLSRPQRNTHCVIIFLTECLPSVSGKTKQNHVIDAWYSLLTVRKNRKMMKKRMVKRSFADCWLLTLAKNNEELYIKHTCFLVLESQTVFFYNGNSPFVHFLEGCKQSLWITSYSKLTAIFWASLRIN